MRVSKSSMRPVSSRLNTTSFSAKWNRSAPCGDSSRACSNGRRSASQSPASTALRRVIMSCGSTSVRNPRRPRLMPSSGTSCSATRPAAYNSVPSPPMAIIRSARSMICARGSTRTPLGALAAAAILRRQHFKLPRKQLRNQRLGAFGDPWVLEFADQRRRCVSACAWGVWALRCAAVCRICYRTLL